MNNARKKLLIGLFAVCGFIVFLSILGNAAKENKEKRAAEAAQAELNAFVDRLENELQSAKNEFDLAKNAIVADLVPQVLDANYIDNFVLVDKDDFDLDIILPGQLMEQAFFASGNSSFEDWTKSYATHMQQLAAYAIPNHYHRVAPGQAKVRISLKFLNDFGTTTNLAQLEYIGQEEYWTFHGRGLFQNASRSNNQLNQSTREQQQNLVYITNTGKSYHRQGCRHLRSVAGSGTASDLASRGYSACSVCRP